MKMQRPDFDAKFDFYYLRDLSPPDYRIKQKKCEGFSYGRDRLYVKIAPVDVLATTIAHEVIHNLGRVTGFEFFSGTDEYEKSWRDVIKRVDKLGKAGILRFCLSEHEIELVGHYISEFQAYWNADFADVEENEQNKYFKSHHTRAMLVEKHILKSYPAIREAYDRNKYFEEIVEALTANPVITASHTV